MAGSRFANLLTAIVLLITLAAAVCGTAGSQYRGDSQVGADLIKRRVYLYAVEQDVNDGPRDTTYYDRGDFACKSYFDKLATAFAFGLIAIFASFLGFIIATLRICVLSIHRFSVTFFAIVAFISLVIAFAISISTYTMSQCDTTSFKTLNYTVDWGFALLVIGAGFALISVIFSLIFTSRHDHNHRDLKNHPTA